MKDRLNRREFLHSSVIWGGGLLLSGYGSRRALGAAGKPLFEISLAEWSLHRTLRAGKLDNLDFPKTAKEDFDIAAVEFVNQFFKDKAEDRAYLSELKRRSEDVGVKTLLIMIDGEGALGDPDRARQKQAVENHFKWVAAAKFLGCHSIRVNAQTGGRGSFEEQQERAATGLRELSEFAAEHDLNVIVENHGGLSSHGAWLAGVMRRVNLANCGTLPDFGNFNIGRGEQYDRYQGVKEMMPYAKAVSAKSHDFDDEGNETQTDYRRMMKIVLDAGYRGFVGVEYEGGKLSETEGIRRTRDLLIKVREKLTPAYR
jgi:sugar phosphate isomerase/epimerase